METVNSRRVISCIASMALRIRLSITCSTCILSARTKSARGSNSKETRTPVSLAPTRASALASSIILRQVLDLPLALAAGDEFAQAADDLAGAQRLLGRALHRLAAIGILRL